MPANGSGAASQAPMAAHPYGRHPVSGRIPQEFIDDLVQRADIVEVVGSRVPLTKAGREYKARCPFHAEKTPSFWVSPAKGFYTASAAVPTERRSAS